jgi:hypothetical protein
MMNSAIQDCLVDELHCHQPASIKGGVALVRRSSWGIIA